MKRYNSSHKKEVLLTQMVEIRIKEMQVIE